MMERTEKKGVDDRKVLKIEGDLHQAIDIESAHTRIPMYALVRQAWDAYLVSKGRQVEKGNTESQLEQGLTSRQVKLVNRYADLLRSRRDPDLLKVVETVLDRIESSSKPEEYQNKKTG